MMEVVARMDVRGEDVATWGRRLRMLDLNVVPQTLEEELMIIDSFRFFDRDGDGRISKEELGSVVRSLGQKVSDADLEQVMLEVDTNGDGCIDLAEFMELNARAMVADPSVYGTSGGVHPDDHQMDHFEALPSTRRSADDSASMSAFNVFDVDKDGFISAEELHFVLAGFGDDKVSVDDCRCMIQCVDEDGDDMVNFREFTALMNGSFATYKV